MAITSRRYYAYFKFDSSDVALFEKRLVDALNFVAKEGERSRAAMSTNDFGLLIEKGIDAIEEEAGANLEETSMQLIAKKLAVLREDKAIMNALAEIYEHEGLDAFVEWCENNGIKNWASAMETYNEGIFAKKAQRPWSEQAHDWLAEFLGDGKPHHIDEVKEEALRDGVLDEESDETIDRDWHKLKVVASRKGYSARGARGWWEE